MIYYSSKSTQYFQLVLAAIGMCLGQILLKKGMIQVGNLSFSLDGVALLLRSIFTNPTLLAGCLISGVTTLLWLVMLSHMDLSYALPMLNAIYFVLVLLLSLFIFREDVSLGRWLGTALIIAGMVFVSRG